VIELFQTEWCPSSRRVRQRLTELGLDFCVRQVPVEPSQRTQLLAETGVTSIPVLRDDGDPVVVGEDAILTYLDWQYREPADGEAHRARAHRARPRELREAGCIERIPRAS